MSTTLCERCFPDWGHHEVQSKAIFAICEECQKTEAQADVKLHTFRGDPRSKASDTPRVDAASFKVIGPVPERATSVPAEMARELERELAAVTRERDDAYANVKDADRELKALRAEVERLLGALQKIVEYWAEAPSNAPTFFAIASGMEAIARAALQEPTP